MNRLAAPCHASIAVLVGLLLVGCDRGGERNLWQMDLANRPTASTGVDGYWEGDVAMGGIRVLVEPSRVTVALRCDGAGSKLAQATAPVVLADAPERMVLQADLAGGDDECGFRFIKGNEFGYRLSGPGVLEIAFAGASVSRLTRLADPAPR